MIKVAEERLRSVDSQLHELWTKDISGPTDLSTSSLTTMMLDVVLQPDNQPLLDNRKVR